MGKIAFVFPGQGAQYTGMGKDIYENNATAKSVFDSIDKIRENTSNQCFNADISELSITKNTQPCIFTVEMALAKALKAKGVEPDMLAGFSLGEVTALTFAEVFNFEDGVNFICKRAKYMQEANEKVSAGMVAALKLDDETIEKTAKKFNKVYPVNYNCPGQVVVSGDLEELLEFSKEIKEQGGSTIALKVSGGFHSPFMDEASDNIFNELKEVNLNKPKYPVYSNYFATIYPDCQKCDNKVHGTRQQALLVKDGCGSYNVKETIAKQVNNPVLWKNIVQDMIDNGVDTFIEVGPGKVLSGLIKKINPNVKIYNVCDNETLNNIENALKM